MKQLTIRGFGTELERQIRSLARADRTSLNQTVLRLLRKGAGLDREEDAQPTDRSIGSRLDDLIGTWSEEETREFNKAVRDLESIDDELWR